MEQKINKRDWFRLFSPAIWGIAFSVIGIIISIAGMEKSGGWSFLGIILLAPIVAILLTFDILVKAVFKINTSIIWLVELLLLGLIYAFWISKFV